MCTQYLSFVMMTSSFFPMQCFNITIKCQIIIQYFNLSNKGVTLISEHALGKLLGASGSSGNWNKKGKRMNKAKFSSVTKVHAQKMSQLVQSGLLNLPERFVPELRC